MPDQTLLIILDGWGYRKETQNNAIAEANTPTWDKLIQQYSSTLIDTSGLAVGLPKGQMGNSEVGHMNIGAGRVVYQDSTRITKEIAEGALTQMPLFVETFKLLKNSNKTLHVMGLLSPGGVHSYEEHLFSLLKAAASYDLKNVVFHIFLDGRDTPPKSAAVSINKLQQLMDDLQCGQIATVSGRYYAMDRDNRWDRIEKAYNAIALRQSTEQASDAISALEQGYERDETDEFILPTLIGDADEQLAVKEGDVVCFMNFRADRARQLTQAFTLPNFKEFATKKINLASFICLTEYQRGLPVKVAFEPFQLKNVLGEIIAAKGLKQLRIAETEKYAHVTYFFNGGKEDPFVGENRVMVPSPKVATYDLQPEMSAFEVTQNIVDALLARTYGLIVCNYANPDMVGHTGKIPAAIKAVETIDACLEKLLSALKQVDGQALITADHGNIELMVDENTGQPHTAHTCGQVPLVYVGNSDKKLKSGGALCNIAPTLLGMMSLTIPIEMKQSGSLLL